ncbi:Alkylglycerol monooxygenase [Orchesella cincta]|uniref:Alkylglycerol monooxygenase n=1 Tax=Orchesella cincta TaxID=48709 RepID=A0A1D2ML27_ORCCI|nr:Alkylglycerol monooxygenase [Orchesella cincta]
MDLSWENCSVSSASTMAKNVGRLFYVVPPEGNTFQSVEDVPYYFSEMFPLFLGLIIAEYIALAMKGEGPRLAESLNSLSHGIISETFKILLMGVETSIYVYVHNHFRLIDLPWDNPLTWYAALIAVDFCYYWAHRASHEINFLWAMHQIHHSSEDFNMAVAVRHPLTHNWINSFFYLPLAFIIPPPQCLAHQQLNLLYQGWIHTSLVGSLGPLEYIFNTPSHHKVHHSCTIRSLDTNYGGLLIIWDRIFFSFCENLPEEELVFGVVFQHESHNPIWQTWYRFPALWQWAKMQKTWGDSFRALFFGPSWIPGAPRLGRDEDKVKVTPRPKFTVLLPKWLQAYLLIHFFAVLVCFQKFALEKGGALRLYFLPSMIVWIIYLLHQVMICYKAELKQQAFGLGTKLNAQYEAPTSKIYNGKSNFCLVENTAVLKTS